MLFLRLKVEKKRHVCIIIWTLTLLSAELLGHGIIFFPRQLLPGVSHDFFFSCIFFLYCLFKLVQMLKGWCAFLKHGRVCPVSRLAHSRFSSWTFALTHKPWLPGVTWSLVLLSSLSFLACVGLLFLKFLIFICLCFHSHFVGMLFQIIS